jgi:hypothetical protein
MDVLRKTLVGVTVAGLAVDAYVHLKVAGSYDTVKATVSQGQLFRLEAVLAIVAAVVLLLRPNRLTAGIATLVAGGGVVALLLYYFVNVGQLGPLPNMYEPVLYAEKVVTLIAQSVATVTAAWLVAIGWQRDAAASPVRSQTAQEQIARAARRA